MRLLFQKLLLALKNYFASKTELASVGTQLSHVAGKVQTLDETSLRKGEASLSGRFVDLGLPSGILWAKSNLYYEGLMASEGDFGDLFAWGEGPREMGPFDEEDFTPQNYGAPAKYTETMGDVTLDAEDDAANVVLGGGWRMPTLAEMQELFENCSASWQKRRSSSRGRIVYHWGIELIGPNGNSIFLPAKTISNYKYQAEYLTSMALTDGEDDDVYTAYIYGLDVVAGNEFDAANAVGLDHERYLGRYIRPVIAAADILKEEQVLQVKGTTIQLMPKAAIEEAFRAASPFIARYGQETFDQILAAKRAGKEIMCEFTGTPDGYEYLIGDVLTGLFPLQYFEDQDDENIHTAKFHSIVEAREEAESTNGVTGHLGITLICEPSGWSISTLFVPTAPELATQSEIDALFDGGSGINGSSSSGSGSSSSDSGGSHQPEQGGASSDSGDEDIDIELLDFDLFEVEEGSSGGLDIDNPYDDAIEDVVDEHNQSWLADHLTIINPNLLRDETRHTSGSHLVYVTLDIEVGPHAGDCMEICLDFVRLTWTLTRFME